MIRVKIREEAERRGITTAYQLGQEFDFSPDLAARLWKGEKYPRLETLDKLCTKWECALDTLVTCVREPAQKKARAAKRR
jgi:DNA-binding Xre family transcriptional regulator